MVIQKPGLNDDHKITKRSAMMHCNFEIVCLDNYTNVMVFNAAL
jgi:hypothetical protein